MTRAISRNMSRLCVASAVTLVGSSIVFYMLGQPSFIGIDDANITQVYARNLSNGHGYVYTPGYERVEGSTSILWTLINAAAFSVSRYPEATILGLSFLLTIGAIYFSLCIFELLFRRAGLEPGASLVAMSLIFLGLFGFYTWNVLSLMDLALWTFLLNGFILLILLRIDGQVSSRISLILISVLSVLMGLARPEAMVLVPVLLLLGVAGEWKLAPWPEDTLRVYGLGFVGYLLTTAGLTLFRFFYFGVPFPNTYYAKVSQEPVDNVGPGLAYIAKFIVHGSYADALVLAAGGCFIITAWQSYVTGVSSIPLQLHRCLFVLSGAILIVLGFPLATGGDHFESFRFFQPIYPLLFVLVFVGLVAGLRNLLILNRLSKGLRTFLFVAVWSVFFASMIIGYSTKLGIGIEFRIAARGRAVGEALNVLLARSPRTRVAVVAAGGIALTYKGRVVDLMGLNWPLMAHATGVRNGPYGHSAFEESVFWDELPELVIPRLSDSLPQTMPELKPILTMLDGMPRSARFKKMYAPVAIPVAERYVVTYARRDWIEAYARSGRIHELN